MNPPPPTSASSALLAGVEIGGTKLQIVLAESPTEIIGRWRADADRHGGGAAIQRQIETGLRELLAGRTIGAIGVGFGGPIDVASGRIRRSHQIDGWENFPLRDWLAEKAGVPVVVENDANTATLGEAVHGAGRGFNPVFYANFGSGVGGGLVVDGNIYHGASPGEVEFGHLRLERSGATVEDRCSGWAVDRRIREIMREHPQSELARRAAGQVGGEARHLAAVLTADPIAAAILAELAGDVAFALSHVVHLLHPSMIVLGGGLSLIGQPLPDAIAAALPVCVMEAFHPVPPVVLAALGEDAVPVGALELAARIAKI